MLSFSHLLLCVARFRNGRQHTTGKVEIGATKEGVIRANGMECCGSLLHFPQKISKKTVNGTGHRTKKKDCMNAQSADTHMFDCSRADHKSGDASTLRRLDRGRGPTLLLTVNQQGESDECKLCRGK